ncbi:glycoside hydrolase family 68 protein [Fructobacillus parabroussonetiae]|uniref:Glycoside hydrolase family 68 protein n=1 Tax=Fructobacillus parabroussonetiae TaxID=2713174 RepID=A0ABS5QX11_9LACO|nr:glycoside hydrolase family 68 protein [Fructobacillus parabroussonetiae]MBS9337746.1 glycoside hydrolase family 68 protein [Fructobacillus parabroussonetiae]
MKYLKAINLMIKYKKNSASKIICIFFLTVFGFGLILIYCNRDTLKDMLKCYNKDYGIAHITRSQMDSFSNSLDTEAFRAPKYNQKELMKDVPKSKTWDSESQTMKKVPVWDSWPVTNPDGTVADYHGYRLVIGLTSIGARSDVGGAHLGLYSQRIDADSNDINSWEYLGNVFDSFGEGKNSSSDQSLNQMKSEWSGSTILFHQNDDTLRLFYTNAMATGADNQAQALTTAQITVVPKNGLDWKSGLTINHSKATDNKTIFLGDGRIYQTVDQAKQKEGDFYNSFAMRDPHFVEENGKYYLLFETSTSDKYGAEGENNLNNQAYYGSYVYFKNERKRLLKERDSLEFKKAFYGNAAIGMVELNKDFTVKKVMKPLLTANATHDVIERPNVFKYKGKYYLFTCLSADKFATNGKQFRNQSYLLGYSSDSLEGKYEPLNGNGLVLSSSTVKGISNYTYSFLALKPNKNEKNIVITSFANNETFAPSYIMNIKNNKTKLLNDRLLGQGALVDNGKYFKTVPQTKYNG